METYWEGVRRRWTGMVDPQTHTSTGPSGRGTGDGYAPEWKLIRQKFRQVMGREPYAPRELEDWWYSL